MREQEPMTQTMNVTTARQEWSQVLNQVYRGRTRVIVEKSGIPVAAISSAQVLERFKALEAEWEARFSVLDRIRAKNADQDPDEVLRDVTAAVEAVRQEAYDREQAVQRGR